MTKNKIKFLLTILMLCTSLSFALDAADLRLQVEQLERDIKKADAKMVSTDSLAALEAKRFETKKENQEKSALQKKAELDTLTQQLKSLQGKIQREAFQQASLKIKTENKQKLFAETTKQLAVIAESFGTQVQRGIPWDLESRVARVMALKRDLESETASMEEGVSRLAALIREEIKFNDEIVLAERSVTRNSGELLNVQMLRMGNQWLVYMDAEGKAYGRLIRTQTPEGISYTWDEDLDFAERKAVREAIEIKNAKRAPELIKIPLSLSVVEGGTK